MKTNFNTLAPIAAALSRARNAEFVTNVLTADQLNTLDAVGIEIEDKGSCIWRVRFAADVLNDVRKMLDRSAFDARDLEALTLAALYEHRDALEAIADIDEENGYENCADYYTDLTTEARKAAANLTSVRVGREFVDLYDFEVYGFLSDYFENVFEKYILLRNNKISWACVPEDFANVVRGIADTAEERAAKVLAKAEKGEFSCTEIGGGWYYTDEFRKIKTEAPEICGGSVTLPSVLFRALVRGFRANKLNNTPEYYYL